VAKELSQALKTAMVEEVMAKWRTKLCELGRIRDFSRFNEDRQIIVYFVHGKVTVDDWVLGHRMDSMGTVLVVHYGYQAQVLLDKILGDTGSAKWCEKVRKLRGGIIITDPARYSAEDLKVIHESAG
jgi:hypothetical protein